MENLSTELPKQFNNWREFYEFILRTNIFKDSIIKVAIPFIEMPKITTPKDLPKSCKVINEYRSFSIDFIKKQCDSEKCEILDNLKKNCSSEEIEVIEEAKNALLSHSELVEKNKQASNTIREFHYEFNEFKLKMGKIIDSSITTCKEN